MRRFTPRSIEEIDKSLHGWLEGSSVDPLTGYKISKESVTKLTQLEGKKEKDVLETEESKIRRVRERIERKMGKGDYLEIRDIQTLKDLLQNDLQEISNKWVKLLSKGSHLLEIKKYESGEMMIVSRFLDKNGGASSIDEIIGI